MIGLSLIVTNRLLPEIKGATILDTFIQWIDTSVIRAHSSGGLVGEFKLRACDMNVYSWGQIQEYHRSCVSGNINSWGLLARYSPGGGFSLGYITRGLGVYSLF